MARRAGTKQAARATPARIKEISAKVSGSVALTPNSKLAITRVAASARYVFDILMGGPLTGASMNPARSFGSAIC